MLSGGLANECSQVGGTLPQVFLVEHTLGQAAKKAGHAIFEHLPPRAQVIETITKMVGKA
jgi:hypothetical protein